MRLIRENISDQKKLIKEKYGLMAQVSSLSNNAYISGDNAGRIQSLINNEQFPEALEKLNTLKNSLIKLIPKFLD
jgi:hypothetical protein